MANLVWDVPDPALKRDSSWESSLASYFSGERGELVLRPIASDK